MQMYFMIISLFKFDFKTFTMTSISFRVFNSYFGKIVRQKWVTQQSAAKY